MFAAERVSVFRAIYEENFCILTFHITSSARVRETYGFPAQIDCLVFSFADVEGRKGLGLFHSPPHPSFLPFFLPLVCLPLTYISCLHSFLSSFHPSVSTFRLFISILFCWLSCPLPLLSLTASALSRSFLLLLLHLFGLLACIPLKEREGKGRRLLDVALVWRVVGSCALSDGTTDRC